MESDEIGMRDDVMGEREAAKERGGRERGRRGEGQHGQSRGRGKQAGGAEFTQWES